MSKEIIAVHLDSMVENEQNITKVRLSNQDVQSVREVVNNLDYGTEYYFTTSNNSRAEVEAVHPENGNPYIRTKHNQTTTDNLLSLPKF